MQLWLATVCGGKKRKYVEHSFLQARNADLEYLVWNRIIWQHSSHGITALEMRFSRGERSPNNFMARSIQFHAVSSLSIRCCCMLLVHFLVTLLDDITGVESRPEAVTDLLEGNIRGFR